MIKTLVLTNFRQHKHREFVFAPGLNVLRGENEIGKTSILEAVTYAFFGAIGLRDSVAAVVTYDQPESTMQVRMSFALHGVDYDLKRGPNGAEMTYADQRVTGQTGVTRFCEGLFGCSAAIAKMLLIADQNDIRGVLAAGGPATGNLVEKLADLSALDTIIEKVQQQLPCGNTKAIEAQVTQLVESPVKAEEPPTDDALQAAQNRLSSTKAQIENQNGCISVLAPKKIAAQQVLARAAEVQISIRNAVAERQKLTAVTSAEIPAAVFTQVELDEARRLVADSAALDKVRKAYATKFPPAPAITFPGSYQGLHETILLAQTESAKTQANLKEKEIAYARKKALLITESQCAFCKKEIGDLPEVASINAEVTATLGVLHTDIEALKAHAKKTDTALAEMRELSNHCIKMQALAGDSWALSDTLPYTATWLGQVPPAAGQLPNVKLMEHALAAHAQAVAKRDAAQASLDALVVPEPVDTVQAEVDLESIKTEEDILRILQNGLNEATTQFKLEEQAFGLKTRAYERSLEQVEQYKKTLEDLRGTLDLMFKHNELVKALRAARPEITSKLWGTVLGAVSHYLGKIRERESYVTRDTDGFKVNGRSVDGGGFSGSAKDALGLAIRIALAKTFLPGVPLLLLDEPFAACDNGREVAGLGTVAAAGFDQTILITHSDLADALADNLLAI